MITTLSIPGIHCQACTALIKDVSGDFPAIRNADVNIETKLVTLEHDDGFSLQDWIREIESLDDKYRIQPAT